LLVKGLGMGALISSVCWDPPIGEEVACFRR